MIVSDTKKNGKWLRTVGTSTRHTTWAGAYYAEMLRRCNPALQTGKYESYAGCTSEFVDFQDFAEWATKQVGYGQHLDKDILLKGNKVYSKETCVFVPSELNNLLTKCNRSRGDQPLGVSFNKRQGYKACVANGGEKVYLGHFKTADEAFNAYKVAKENFIKTQANKWRSQIDERVYNALNAYQVEITD